MAGAAQPPRKDTPVHEASCYRKLNEAAKIRGIQVYSWYSNGQGTICAEWDAMWSRPLARRTLVVAALAGWLGPSGARGREAGTAPLEIAVVPFLSPRLLVSTYEPVRAAIQAAVGRPAYLITAPNFRRFLERTRAGEYALAVTAPHFARLAELESRCRPIAQWRGELRGVFLVEEASPVRTLAGLRGRIVATPDPLALITMMAVESLAADGLAPGTDVRLEAQPSHNAALLAVLRQQAAAAVMSTSSVKVIDPALTGRVRPLAYTAPNPRSLVFLAGPALGEGEAATIRDALRSFCGSPAGRRFLAHNGLTGVDPLPPGGLAGFDRFLPRLRRQLAVPGGRG